jgi:hypothetical protein
MDVRILAWTQPETTSAHEVLKFFGILILLMTKFEFTTRTSPRKTSTHNSIHLLSKHQSALQFMLKRISKHGLNDLFSFVTWRQSNAPTEDESGTKYWWTLLNDFVKTLYEYQESSTSMIRV